LNVLLALLRGAKGLTELRAEVGSSDTTILHALKDLEAMYLTVKSDRAYELTTLGIMESLIIDEASSAAEVLQKFRDFWLLHDITYIPPHLLRRIGALKDSTLIRANTLKLKGVHETFLKIILTSKRIMGISPIFHSDYVSTFNQLLSKGALVDLILTTDVFKKTLEVAGDEIIGKYLKEESLKLFINDRVNVALTVTEKVFSLGLFTSTGEYDYNMDLISHNLDALVWGESLFKHFLKNSEQINR
jgi:predicted transcriptional regulator